MTVQQLIDQLNKFDKNMEVKITDIHEEIYTPYSTYVDDKDGNGHKIEKYVRIF